MGVGIFIIKNGLLLVAGAALGALAVIGIGGRASKKIKPALVSATKEGYAFKEWLAGQYERTKEDVEDIVAEGKHAYHKDLEATSEAIGKEKEILEKAEGMVTKKIAKNKAKPKVKK